MPSSNPEPIDTRTTLTDEERFDIYVCGAIYTALRDCTRPHWILLNPDRGEVGQSQDLHATAGAVLRRLKREGLRVIPADEHDPVWPRRGTNP